MKHHLKIIYILLLLEIKHIWRKINKNYNACIRVQHIQWTPAQTENTQAEI